MDEAVQLPPNLLMRFKKAAEAVEKATSVRVISHNDADGICSASIICSMLFRKCKQFQCSMVKGFDENFVRGSVEGHDLLIISDMGSNNLDVLESLGIAIVPMYCVKEDLKSGALREVLAHFPVPVHPLSLVFPPGKPTPRKIRALADFLADWFRKHPIPQ